MPKVIRIKKGLDIKLKGKPEKIIIQADPSEFYAVKPPDFPGLSPLPKLSVIIGSEGTTGSPLFYDKNKPDILFTSPVSGKVVAVNRGERRRILEVVIESDKKNEAVTFQKGDPKTMNRETIVNNLLKSGVWPFIRQRPFHIIADPDDDPRAIFISGFDSAPLAPDLDFILNGEEASFQTGIDVLSQLTSGKIHIGVNAVFATADVFSKTEGVELHKFRGPHPAGNVGVQINHVDPVKKGEQVWTVNAQDVIVIGKLFEKGVFNPTRLVALTGSEVIKPRYYRTKLGASVKPLLKDNVKEGNNRYISGNVLTGSKISKEGFIGFYDSQVTVIPEGDFYEFLGWALPGLKKFSASRTFFSFLTPNNRYTLHTNLQGGRRAFVLTGQYEKVLPMDIYPMQLLKAILVEDIDLMENLGIYEVAEEDFALCEYVCTSKTEVQSILRSGFELMQKELG